MVPRQVQPIPLDELCRTVTRSVKKTIVSRPGNARSAGHRHAADARTWRSLGLSSLGRAIAAYSPSATSSSDAERSVRARTDVPHLGLEDACSVGRSTPDELFGR